MKTIHALLFAVLTLISVSEPAKASDEIVHEIIQLRIYEPGMSLWDKLRVELRTQEAQRLMELACVAAGVDCQDQAEILRRGAQILYPRPEDGVGKGDFVAPPGYEVCRAVLVRWDISDRSTFTSQMYDHGDGRGVVMAYDITVPGGRTDAHWVDTQIYMQYVPYSRRGEFNCRAVPGYNWACIQSNNCDCAGRPCRPPSWSQ